MRFLTDRKKPFLEFIRNLTPQVLILTVALLSIRDLAPTCCDLGNLGKTALAAILWMTFIAVYVANAIFFMEEYLKPADDQAEGYKELQKAKVGIRTFIFSMIRYTWRNDKWFFAEFVIVTTLLQVGIFVVTLTAVFAASNYLGQLVG